MSHGPAGLGLAKIYSRDYKGYHRLNENPLFVNNFKNYETLGEIPLNNNQNKEIDLSDYTNIFFQYNSNSDSNSFSTII